MSLGGLLSGLLGVGGGIVMVPLLVLWAHYGQRDAHAASLGAIIPISIAGIATYGIAGEVRVGPAIALPPGSIFGAQIGTGMLARLDERVLKTVFGALSPRRRGADGRPRMTGATLYVALVAFGVLAGVASGLLGVGGGTLLVPFLTLAVGLSQHEAEATSLLVILPTAIAGTLALRRRGVGNAGSRFASALSARSARCSARCSRSRCRQRRFASCSPCSWASLASS